MNVITHIRQKYIYSVTTLFLKIRQIVKVVWGFFVSISLLRNLLQVIILNIWVIDIKRRRVMKKKFAKMKICVRNLINNYTIIIWVRTFVHIDSFY